MGLRATLEPISNVLGKGIFKNEFLGLIPQVLREELNSKVITREKYSRMMVYWGSKDSTSRLTGNRLLCKIGAET